MVKAKQLSKALRDNINNPKMENTTLKFSVQLVQKYAGREVTDTHRQVHHVESLNTLSG